MPRKISNSAITDSEEERRPVAKNMRKYPPKPIPIDKASFALELLNNQTRPVVNIVGTRHFHENPIPLDKNYPIEIELQRIAMEAVPNKPPFQPLKTKSPFTEDMIEKYREEERRGIRQRGYDVPQDILADLEFYEEIPPEYYENFNRAMKELESELAEGLVLYDRAKKNVPVVMKQLKDLDDEYNNASSVLRATEGRVYNKDGDKKVYLDKQYIYKKQQLENYLDTLQMDMRNLQEEKNMIEDRMEQMKTDRKEFEAGDLKEKQTNARKIKNAEDKLRLLNNTLPIQQMKGEPDEVYRDRLIALRVPVDNSRVDATEARMFEHKVFKRNLKKLIDLPLYQVDNIIKMLDLNDMERTYQLNEIFPKVESEFIKQFGRKPLLRNPEQTLTDFFASILEAPLQAQEQSEAITALSEQQSVSSGDIDPSLKGLKKAEVLKLLKDAGLTKKRAQEFQKMTVNKLKVLYTEHLKKVRTPQAEAFGFLSQLGQKEQQKVQARNQAQLEQMLRYQQEEDDMMRAEDKEVRQAEKEYNKEAKAQKKIGQKEQAGFKKAQSFIQQRIAEEEARQAESQTSKRRGRPPKEPKQDKGQQMIAKFMSQQASKR
jgi:hypothetical protein